MAREGIFFVVVIPDFRKKGFQLFIVKYEVNYEFFHKRSVFEMFSLYSNFDESFLIMNKCWFLSNAFSVSIEMFDHVIFIPSFVNMMQCIDLQILNHPWIFGINHTWSQCIILFIYYWIWFANMFFRIFSSIIIRYIDHDFLFSSVFIRLWCQGNGDLQWIWEC